MPPTGTWSSPSSGLGRERATEVESPDSAPRLIALGGGKGGVGKTFLAANLAASLARAGARVVAVDTDVEGANLHTWLGVASPRGSPRRLRVRARARPARPRDRDPGREPRPDRGHARQPRWLAAGACAAH